MKIDKQYFIALFILFLGLAGCAKTIQPAFDIYAINTTCETNNPSQKKANSSKSLKILTPKSISAIASRNILYQENEHTQYPYAYSRWNDAPTKMLGILFLSCISKHDIFRAVLPSQSKGKSDFLLESMIFEFYHNINLDGSSEGRVRIEFYLIETKDGRVIATNEFFSKVSSKTHDAKEGAIALNEASKSIVLDLTQWLSSLEDFNDKDKF
jgi:cholesterol transport system auxiliary component